MLLRSRWLSVVLLAMALPVAAQQGAKEPTAAPASLDAAAQSGDARAATALGVLAYRDHDPAAAEAHWRQAAAGGDTDAHFNLGLLWSRDPQRAADANREFEAAARDRHVLACFALGTRLAAQDEKAAREWLECAASQGYAPAQFNLATLYRRASDSPGDIELARRWFAAAAPTFAPAAAALAALPVEQTSAPSSASLRLRDTAWVMAQAKSAYTVQIASGTSSDELNALLRRVAGDNDAACVLEHPDSRQAYSAIVGVFPDRASAERARAALPAAVRANSPWVRRYGALQQALRDADKNSATSADAHAESN